MVRIHGQIRGVPETQAGLQQVVPILQEELDQAVRASLFDVTRHAQQHYLSGPRPQRLGVITNRLRGSLTEGQPGFVFDLQRRQATITGMIGTNVEYAEIHERGGVIRPVRGQYLAIPTNFIKTPAGQVRAPYNRPLREIPNTFFIRSKTGGLSLWESLPGRRRRRGEGLSTVARPIYWLVRQVTIPARPFLTPALRDRTQAITERFTQHLRRVEQRVSALFRG